jgi:hypothetical protein
MARGRWLVRRIKALKSASMPRPKTPLSLTPRTLLPFGEAHRTEPGDARARRVWDPFEQVCRLGFVRARYLRATRVWKKVLEDKEVGRQRTPPGRTPCASLLKVPLTGARQRGDAEIIGVLCFSRPIPMESSANQRSAKLVLQPKRTWPFNLPSLLKVLLRHTVPWASTSPTPSLTAPLCMAFYILICSSCSRRLKSLPSSREPHPGKKYTRQAHFLPPSRCLLGVERLGHGGVDLDSDLCLGLLHLHRKLTHERPSTAIPPRPSHPMHHTHRCARCADTTALLETPHPHWSDAVLTPSPGISTLVSHARKQPATSG